MAIRMSSLPTSHKPPEMAVATSGGGGGGGGIPGTGGNKGRDRGNPSGGSVVPGTAAAGGGNFDGVPDDALRSWKTSTAGPVGLEATAGVAGGGGIAGIGGGGGAELIPLRSPPKLQM